MFSLIKRAQGKKWKNWAETHEGQPESTFYPSSVDKVVTIVKEAANQGKKIRVIGAGHSFTNLVGTEQWLVSLDQLTGIEQVDEANDTVTVFGGTRLYQLGKELDRLGYAQENLGDINVQSIAGAISTGTHGTGLSFGNIPTQVEALTFVTAKGELLTVSEEENADYFKASLISLGTFGIIVKVKLKVVECPVYEYRCEKINYPLFVEKLDDYIKNNRHFEFYIFPYSDLVQVKRMNVSKNKPQRLFFHHCKDLVMENYLLYVLSTGCKWFPKRSRMISKFLAKGISETNITANSHQLFATPRLVKFTEIEYCIPLHYLKLALDEVRSCIEEKNHEVHFPIECRVVNADDIWLSPSYERESAYIAFHMFKGMPYESYFRDMEAIMRKYEGRPHWAKMHNLNQKDLQNLYPKLSDFLTIREKLDPNGMFMNEYLEEKLGKARVEKEPVG